MTDVQVKRKVIRTDYVSPCTRDIPSRPSSPSKIARPVSPTKSRPATTVTPATPPSRPRAKISSSANVRKPAGGGLAPSYAASSGTSTPRAPSPVKQLDFLQGRSSPQSLSVARMRAKTNATATASAPSSPRLANAQLVHATVTATTSDSALAKSSPPRVRHASVSSMSQLSSTSSVRVNSMLSPASSVVSGSQDQDGQSSVSPMRIKAKVTGMAKSKAVTAPATPTPGSSFQTSPSVSSSPSTSSSPPIPYGHQRMGRTASISSLSSKEPVFYPITTASPAANVHRFATVRSSSISHRAPQSLVPMLQTERAFAHVDPSLVPLPPLSPPSSTLSFSSHSSVSRLSVSSSSCATAPSYNVNVNGTSAMDRDLSNDRNGKPRSNSVIIHDLDNVREERSQFSPISVNNDDEEERKMRAEAKSNRKIADLEITNKSLLAINSQLEATKHKQAKEIRDLRRRVRESRLILPPRAYRQLESNDSTDVVDDDEDDEEEGANTSVDVIELGKDDEVFMRVRGIIDSLLESGRRALETKVEDFASKKLGTRVLHEEEARTWRYGGATGSDSRAQAEEAMENRYDESFVTADSDSDAGEPCLPKEGLVGPVDTSFRSEEEIEVIVGT